MRIKFFLLFFSVYLHAETAELVRQCRVYDKPTRDAKLVCTLQSREQITIVRQVDQKISEIFTPHCKGYLYVSCFSVREETSRESEKGAKENRGKVGDFKIGFTLEGEGPIASVASSSVYSTGLGFSIGALAQYRIRKGVYLLALPSYRHQKLSRKLDASGSLQDPSATIFTQTVWNVSLGFATAVNLTELAESNNTAWTIKLGTEFLLPTSATQTDSSGGEETFTATKMINLLIGSAFGFPLSPILELSLGADIFYHITAKDSTSLYGIRAGGALVFAL